ncbi:MAG TPA: trimeric intracellular cation channel family protein [Chloroflexia bacterium]|nr:trimeric intracellular cation channel family protein [Chloroflexia bacterium]
METLVLVLDLFGTFVFALSGGMRGVRHRLDVFGVLVLSFAAGNAGGITRDLLLGAVPPAAIADWRYVGVSLLAGLTTFLWTSTVWRWKSAVLVFDAAGLGLFAVSGALKALAFGLNPVAAVLLGMLTGIGGGMLRDVLVTEIPTVLRAELYAVAALAGAVVVVGGELLRFPSTPLAIAGTVLCFGLRLLAIRRGWGLPVARAPGAKIEHEEKEKPTR